VLARFGHAEDGGEAGSRSERGRVHRLGCHRDSLGASPGLGGKPAQRRRERAAIVPELLRESEEPRRGNAPDIAVAVEAGEVGDDLGGEVKNPGVVAVERYDADAFGSCASARAARRTSSRRSCSVHKFCGAKQSIANRWAKRRPISKSYCIAHKIRLTSWQNRSPKQR